MGRRWRGLRARWRGRQEILNHFASAVHLGMTATPKQDKNIDTHAYFCAEEPEVVAESGETVHRPTYSYSLGQGTTKTGKPRFYLPANYRGRIKYLTRPRWREISHSRMRQQG